MFVMLNFLKIIYFLSDIPQEFFFRQILNWLTLPAGADSFFSRPWTLLSYMFTHIGFWHLLTSMLWLWCFGYILQDLAGNSKLIPVYLYGGFIGGIIFLLVNNFSPGLEKNIGSIQPMLGAGAAVMAVVVATTTLAPDYRLFPMIGGGIPLWVVALIFVAIDLATLANVNPGIGAAHLAAGATGFLFTRQLRKGNDWSGWMTRLVDWVDDLFNPEKKHTKKTRGDKHFYRADRKPFQKTPNVTQQKLDAILDKINQQGYEFLSEEEKEFLKRASNDLE
jgi:membrane associated rhomboid family serine protease